ncbi:helicase [Flammeovirga pectinis]|uniref:Helicase n=1 Tax=Flammeovirga pectinis TaxID=2494373 RepID=A0A3S9NYJ3_9BACT|nr:helix-turn-helix domain-containing protein [Flammeovirga pectinis]AZQ60916.1 helicase [Flammeovirga pectinis]
MENSLQDIVSKYVNTTNCNIFLTGKAGTGKTTLLRSLHENTHKSVCIAAPTGIAAINAGGVTIHSLFQLPFGSFIPDPNLELDENATTVAHINTPKSLFKGMKMGATKRAILEGMELLIIDEVSMLRADMLDAMDLILRSARKRKDLPFGGVQMLFIGDMLQLPPVIKQDEWQYLYKYYPNGYFFNAKVFQETSMVHVELNKVYRQADPTFVNILNHLRENKVTSNDVKVLNTHYNPDFKQSTDDGYIQLTTHNKIANEKNQSWLKEIKGKEYEYQAKVIGEFSESQYPNEEILRLKVDAQVMFIKNDYSGEGRYFNGKIGKVTRLTNEDIYVEFDDGTPEFSVEKYSWENKKYVLNKITKEVEEVLIGEFHQFPLKLAWAITVHKSQGLTFEKAIIDVGRAFAAGQTYVALSRLTSLDGLVLASPISERGIAIDRNLSAFTQSCQPIEELTPQLKLEARNFIHQTLMNAFDLSYLTDNLLEHLTSYDMLENLSTKQRHKKWAKQLLDEIQKIKKVGQSFMHQSHKIIIDEHDGYIKHLLERVEKAIAYFNPLLKEKHKLVMDHHDSLNGQSGVIAYRNELKVLSSHIYNQGQRMLRSEKLILSYIDGNDLLKQDINKPDYVIKNEKRKDVPLKAKVRVSDKGDKTRKIATHIQTYVLFRNGNSIEEIARERGMYEGAVETHIAKCIGLGKIEVSEIIKSKVKRNKIEKAVENAEDKSLKNLKEVLGSKYTYGEIKYVIAGIEANN